MDSVLMTNFLRQEDLANSQMKALKRKDSLILLISLGLSDIKDFQSLVYFERFLLVLNNNLFLEKYQEFYFIS